MESRTLAGRARRGFTLIELVIVVSVILIIAAVTIPLTIRNRVQANETSAIASLRTIATAEQQFLNQELKDSNDDGTSDYALLSELVTPPDNEVAPFIDTALGRGFKAGYDFDIEVFLGDGILDPAFSAFAIPIQHNFTGIRNFYIDQTGVLRFTRGEDEVGILGPESPPVQ